MLKEWLTSLRTLCPPDLVALGYRYAAVACLSRAARCAQAWAPHQQASRRAILAAMADAPADRDTALILGSGPCFDLPLPELRARFDRVVLADVAHPPRARRLAAEDSGLELACVELTGTATALRDPATVSPPVPGTYAFTDRAGIGLVVSLNLISQLPLIPVAQARRRWPAADLDGFAHAIIAAHLDHLRRFDCPVLLIGDVARRYLDSTGVERDREDPLLGVTLPPGPEWDWLLAPPGEARRGMSIINRVRAVRLAGADQRPAS